MGIRKSAEGPSTRRPIWCHDPTASKCGSTALTSGDADAFLPSSFLSLFSLFSLSFLGFSQGKNDQPSAINSSVEIISSWPRCGFIHSSRTEPTICLLLSVSRCLADDFHWKPSAPLKFIPKQQQKDASEAPFDSTRPNGVTMASQGRHKDVIMTYPPPTPPPVPIRLSNGLIPINQYRSSR